MKKQLSAMLAAVLCAVMLCTVFAAVPASAEDVKYTQLLVMGDSISTGYGLPNYVSSNPYSCRSYGNLLAEKLGLKSGSTYINKAVNGDRTGDLKAVVKASESVIEKSDLIVVSIGGNNLLGYLTLIATKMTGQSVSSLQTAAAALMSATEEDYRKALADPTVAAALGSSIAAVSTDIIEICGMFSKFNPNARVYFLLQYNPAAGVTTLAAFDKIAAELIAQINAGIQGSVTAAGANFATVDVPSVINDAAAAKTNILAMDIHPNAVGHDAIYQLLVKQLGLENYSAATGTDAPETTECVHGWGEWAEISEGLSGGKRTLERKCTKCGAVEQREEEVTTPVQTVEAVTTAHEASTDTAPESTVSDITPESTGAAAEKKSSGCASSAACAAVVFLIPAAFLYRKKH